MAVIYLVFNEGYSATAGEDLIRRDLCNEAIRLSRILVELLPDEAEVRGLLALLLLQHSRREARTSTTGELLILEDQDRRLWDREAIAEGTRLLEGALAIGRAGPYQIQAAIAALHAEATRSEDTDWAQIVRLYDSLLDRRASPVVELNRAVAVAMDEGVEEGLRLVDELANGSGLDDYLYLHSTRADLLRRLGRNVEAARAYRRALELCQNRQEAKFLTRRLAEVGD